jgi:hypothetical protein
MKLSFNTQVSIQISKKMKHKGDSRHSTAAATLHQSREQYQC